MSAVSAPQTTKIPLNPACINQLPELKKEYNKNIVFTVLVVIAFVAITIAAIALTAVLAAEGLIIATTLTSITTPFGFGLFFFKPFMNCIRLRKEIEAEKYIIKAAQIDVTSKTATPDEVKRIIEARASAVENEINAQKVLFKYAGITKKEPKSKKLFERDEIEEKMEVFDFSPTPIVPAHVQAKIKKLSLKEIYYKHLLKEAHPLKSKIKAPNICSDKYNFTGKREMYNSCSEHPFAVWNNTPFLWNNKTLNGHLKRLEAEAADEVTTLLATS